jgi:hypothetical protein
MRQVQSYRFSDETVQETEDRVLKARVSGVWASPNRWYMKVEPQGEFAGQVSETVVIDQRLFTRESGANGGAWREATPFPANYTVYNPRPESYLAIPDLENVQLLDHDTVEGMAVFQISGVRRETRTSPPRLPQQPEG